MNVPVDTLAFAERFESAGFEHEQARALAVAFGQKQDGAREGLITKADLDLSLAELEGRLAKQFGDLILIQRGFQASSQIISVSNDMIQQLFGIRGQG